MPPPYAPQWILSIFRRFSAHVQIRCFIISGIETYDELQLPQLC